ncbi:glutaredoxin Grx2 [Schizosaccharomyces osmophilus]|uniref:Glutaredoxin Grx2 n=1 Tax=Schizosaccharomyces osmophilus TaxID=2545709 RepID=A0AAF0AXD7_9SCHI|nr:glutaredoxin Grx2 [Schizosaccharomyces osmophilus]WBW73744.1 glutaredoxin Grx2 [Schizosaccharomyces osmophilus]
MSSLAKLFVEKAIASNPVTVFSKSYCPYCSAAKKTLTDYTAPFKSYEIDLLDSGSEIQAYLMEKTNQGTVPSIFFKNEFIGGNSDLTRLRNNGKLSTMLAKLQGTSN